MNTPALLNRWAAPATAQSTDGYLYEVRRIEIGEMGAPKVAGLAYASGLNAMLLSPPSAAQQNSSAITKLSVLTLTPARLAGDLELPWQFTDLSQVTLAAQGDNLFVYDQPSLQLLEISLENVANGVVPTGAITRFDTRDYGIKDLAGMSIDADTGNLYLFDAASSKLVQVMPDVHQGYDGAAAARNKKIKKIPLAATKDTASLSAVDPSSGNIFVVQPNNNKLVEYSQVGEFLSTRDLSYLKLTDPKAIVFAPSGDMTDDSDINNLYIADSGQVIELSIQPPPLVPAATLPITLVNTIDPSKWATPSSDPDGIDYYPGTGQFIVSDSEIETLPAYQGKNVYEMMPSGSLVKTCTTSTFSLEPTGVAVNTTNGDIFFSDDDQAKIFQIRVGTDGIYCTSDDAVTWFSTLAFNSGDPEGVGFGAGAVFIADGTNAEVYMVQPGANGQFDGIPPTGDDVVSHFDTFAFGVTDPEGIDYHAERGTLFIVSQANEVMAETTTEGALVNLYDLSLINGTAYSGVGIGRSSVNATTSDIYITDRNTDTTSVDGKIYEVSISGSTPSTSKLYFSLASNGTVGNLTGVYDEDIVYFNGSTYEMIFDGSDVGIGGTDVDAFYMVDTDTVLMSFTSSRTLSGITVDPNDIVQFDATTLGATTRGTFSLYFDGSDVGLDTTGEDIDAIALLGDGRLLISTAGNPAVPGVNGRDEDILAFKPILLGSNTMGTWKMYFDGSDVDLSNSSEDIDAMDVDTSGAIYLSTKGAFTVTGAAGNKEDIFVCTPTSLGDVTACSYAPQLYFDGSTWGITANDLDAIDLR